MARLLSIADVFSAVATPRRREILEVLAGSDPVAQDVSSLVQSLRRPQPEISKNLRVLRRAGLVSVVQKGKRRMYSLNGHELRPLYDWVKAYERFWQIQLQRIKDHAERLERKSASEKRPPHSRRDS